LGHGANGLVDIGFLTKPYCTSKIINAGRAGGRAAGEPIVPSDRPTHHIPDGKPWAREDKNGRE